MVGGFFLQLAHSQNVQKTWPVTEFVVGAPTVLCLILELLSARPGDDKTEIKLLYDLWPPFQKTHRHLQQLNFIVIYC